MKKFKNHIQHRYRSAVNRVENSQISLVGFLGVALLCASLLVGVAHFLYINSEEYRLDLTRPDLKGIQETDLVEVERSNYDTSSPLSRSALDTEINSMKSRQDELGRYGDFANNELQDDAEQLLTGNTGNPGQ